VRRANSSASNSDREEKTQGVPEVLTRTYQRRPFTGSVGAGLLGLSTSCYMYRSGQADR